MDSYTIDADHKVSKLPPGEYFRKSEENSHLWRVGNTEVGKYRVSTVFLSLDHQHGDGPPKIFETMVFGGRSYHDEYCERYSTWKDAVDGHNDVVALVKRGELP